MNKVKELIKTNKLVNKVYYSVGGFVFEYIANHIICHIPIHFVRYLFYKFVLRIKCEENVYFQMGLYIYSSFGNFSIGENTIINRSCVLDRRNGLYIGRNVNISPYVEIYSSGHNPNSPSFEAKGGRVVIQDRVWLGTRCMIMPGVTIGEGAFVMPGAIVTKDVKPYDIVGGIPARHISNRSKNLTYELDWRMPWG